MNAKGSEHGSKLGRSQDEIELSAWMRAAQNGDGASYRQLLTRTGELMRTFVQNSFHRLRLSDSGGHDDVVQEILLAIHAKRATYDPTQFFLPWLYAIARYKIVDHLRRSGVERRKLVPIDNEVENLAALEASGFGEQLDVEALLGTLPAKQRQILKLTKLDGLSVSEVAERTGYSASDIKINVHRALKALREKVGADRET